MQQNNYYKLVGIINLFGICPDFVYPIFEKNEKYYFQCIEGTSIKSFKEVPQTLLRMISLLDINSTKYIYSKDKYSFGDEFVIAFQLDKNDFFFGGATDFALFIVNFDTDDHILSEKIGEFLNKSKSRNSLTKKKEKIH